MYCYTLNSIFYIALIYRGDLYIITDIWVDSNDSRNRQTKKTRIRLFICTKNYPWEWFSVCLVLSKYNTQEALKLLKYQAIEQVW